MAAQVLVAYSAHTADRGPVNLAAAVARVIDARLVIAAVYSGGAMMDRLAAGEYAGELSSDAHQALDHVKTELQERGLDTEVRVVEATSPARGIAKAIDEVRPALVVVGTTGRGKVGRVLVGSTAQRVIDGAPCPVAVAPRDYEVPAEGLKTVGAAFAPTPEAREALRAAAYLGRSRAAHVRAIMALDPDLAESQSPGLMARQHRETDPGEQAAGRHVIEAKQTLRDAIADLTEGADVESDVLFQDPADALVAASEHLDLLVMGSRAYGPAQAVLLGGVSRRVVAAAACPVVVLPRGTAGQFEALVSAARTTA